VASGRIPDPALPALAGLFAALGEAARSELLVSAHDASDGGLVVAIVELCLAAASGCELELPALAERGDITLFGEACGNVLVTCAPDGRERLDEICRRHEVPLVELGRLGGERIIVRAGSCAVDVALDDARAAYEDALPRAMEPR
jgi:phosphoribosylformylglycinamidine synthase